MSDREIPVVVCFDVEPDPRVFDPDAPPAWDGFERALERLPALRRELETATGRPAAFTWALRMDPQVEQTWGSATWVSDKYGDALAELATAGDELGVHTHLWRWDPAAEGWTADFDDPQWAELCTTTGLDAFEKAFGRTCLVHRGGDRYLSAAMLSCLAARGVRIDLTVEPGSRPWRAPEQSRGLTPDYGGIPTTPYRSSPAAFPAPDPASESDPILVPHLSAPGRRRPLRRHTLGPDTQPVLFASRLALERLRHRAPVIALASRTDTALGPRWDALVRNLKHLARRDQIRFAAAGEALEQLNGASDPGL